MIIAAAAIAVASVAVGVEASWHLDLAAGPTIAFCAIIPAAFASALYRGQVEQ
jgi:ABC-type Mn2+/Zn2+ transport system permease subunit